MKYGTDSDFLGLDPVVAEDFNCPAAYAEFSLPMDLVRKSKVLQLGVDTREAALVRFHDAERLCAATNRRLMISRDPNGRLGELIHRVRKDLAANLPEVTPDLLDKFVEAGGWGGGVTSSVKGGDRRFSSKLVSHQHATTALLPVARALMAEVTGMDGELSVRDYNTVAFVPKDAKTDRAIAVEPSINAYLQRGAGLILRKSLRRMGVDLVHGQLRNAALAKAGSETGAFATIDLEMASDTMAYKLLDYLLPPDWVSLLKLLRTSHYTLDGKSFHRYEKWSSMGNGYTFELESLIFAALVRASVNRGDSWAVYGDDLIVPTYAVPDLASLLEFLGFVLNAKKTFFSGPFRESCGKDYFRGVAVRGFFLKEINPATRYVWHNWLASERLLPCASSTMRELRQDIPNVAPFPDDGAFWVPPLPDHKLGLSRGYRYGRLGWFYYRVAFTPVSIPLSRREELGAIATYCRLAKASEPIDRLAIVESLSEVGRWERRRVFVPDSIGDVGSWPRG